MDIACRLATDENKAVDELAKAAGTIGFLIGCWSGNEKRPFSALPQ
jgi:hypothetical protein